MGRASKEPARATKLLETMGVKIDLDETNGEDNGDRSQATDWIEALLHRSRAEEVLDVVNHVA